MEVGGWVPCLTLNFFGNRPKIALNHCYYFGVVYHVYSVCIYCKKSLVIIIFFDYWNFFNFAKPLTVCRPRTVTVVPVNVSTLNV